jgi:hypothetical protein
VEVIRPYIGLLIPVVLLDLGLRVYCLVDVLRRERFKALPKWAWGLIVGLVGYIGSISYLLLGQEE